MVVAFAVREVGLGVGWQVTNWGRLPQVRVMESAKLLRLVRVAVVVR